MLDFTAVADAESDGDDKVGNTLKHCQASLLQTVPPPTSVAVVARRGAGHVSTLLGQLEILCTCQVGIDRT